MKENTKKYLVVLNVISCISVIILHANGIFWKFSTEKYWARANVIESVFYFAVPIFFMITGATLIDYTEKYNIKIYIRKRIEKTVIPFFIWSIIGLIYKIFQKQINLTDIYEGGVKFLIDRIINSKIIGIYWFFIPLFAIYISIPVLASIPKDKRKFIFSYSAIMLFIFSIFLPFLFQLLKIPYNGNLSYMLASKLMIYIFSAYIIDNYEISKNKKIILYILAIIGLFSHILGTYHLSIRVKSNRNI